MSTPTDPESESGPGTVREKLDSLDRLRRIKYALYLLLVGSIVGAVYWGLGFIGFQAEVVARRFPDFLDFLIGGFLPPNFSEFTIYTKDNDISGLTALWESFSNPEYILESLQNERITLVRATVVTLLLGFLGTALCFPLALILGVLGSERVTPFPFNFIFRGLLSGIRSIPAIVWLILYIPIGPPGQVTAVLAIATDGIGNLGRLFTDELEEVNEGPIEAIRSTGASSTQTVSFGMLSQVSRSFIAWTLYILEINTRIAISLGVLGAGGLGLAVDNAVSLLNYDKAAAALIMVFITVIGIELVSSRIRARLRPGEHSGKSIIEVIRSLSDARKWLGISGRRNRE